MIYENIFYYSIQSELNTEAQPYCKEISITTKRLWTIYQNVTNKIIITATYIGPFIIWTSQNPLALFCPAVSCTSLFFTDNLAGHKLKCLPLNMVNLVESEDGFFPKVLRIKLGNKMVWIYESVALYVNMWCTSDDMNGSPNTRKKMSVVCILVKFRHGNEKAARFRL